MWGIEGAVTSSAAVIIPMLLIGVISLIALRFQKQG